MTDHLVQLSPGLSPDVRAAVATLALAGSFAFAGNPSPTDLESKLLAQFGGNSHVLANDALPWLAENKAEYHDLADMVAQFDSNPVALHTALQQQNDAGGLVLLLIENAALLSEATTGELLHRGTSGPVWLLRSGYSDDPPVGYYYDLGVPGAKQPIPILWQVIAGAGIGAAIALDPPKPPIDEAAVANALHIAEQALLTLSDAVSSVKAAHGIGTQSI